VLIQSTHRCRAAQDTLCAFGSHGWFSSNCSFLSSGGVPGAEYEMATRHCRYNHKATVGSRSESTVPRYICERNNKRRKTCREGESIRSLGWLFALCIYRWPIWLFRLI